MVLLKNEAADLTNSRIEMAIDCAMVSRCKQPGRLFCSGGRMYLVNQFDVVREIQDADQAAALIARGAMREATDDEVKAHLQKRKDQALAAARDVAGGVYYSTVNSSPDGYGMSRDILAREMLARGVFLAENYADQKVGLLYNAPYGIPQMRTAARLVYTMFESDKLPEDWPEYLELADEVIVPSKWCQEVFKKAGIESTVVPLGYNSDIFTFVDRPVPVENKEIFKFIHYDSLNYRKGFVEVFEAFSQEFGPEEPVELILKTVRDNKPVPFVQSEYPNIKIVRGHFSEVDLWKLLGSVNCMVYPSRGEGFGITPLEAMATGLPAIVPNAHGISEYFNADFMLEAEIDHKEPGLYRRYRGQDVGDMTVVSIPDLRKKMRYAYNHQTEMKELGRKASQYVKNFTYKRTAEKLSEVIDKWQAADIQKRPESKFLDVEKF